jgi:hypothetical protein
MEFIVEKIQIESLVFRIKTVNWRERETINIKKFLLVKSQSGPASVAY